jgi:hypothetical protein
MKSILMAGVLAGGVSTGVAAEGLDFNPFVGFEKELESSTTRIELGAATTVSVFDIAAQVNVEDAAGGADFSLNDIELDVAYAVNSMTSVYMENDIAYNSDSFSRAETTVGVRFSF